MWKTLGPRLKLLAAGCSMVLLGPGLFVLDDEAAAQEPEPPAPASPTEVPELEQEPVAESVPLPDAERGDVVAYGEPTPDGLAIVASVGGGPLQAIATLYVQGMESSMWSGTTCVTGSGRYLAASFAPTEMANDPVLRNQGAFLAVVDLTNRSVRLVPERVAFKYHTPGCGPTDEVAALRHLGEDEVTGTELLRIDGATGDVSSRATVDAHLTSPAPVGDRTYASADTSAVSVAADGSVAEAVPPAGGQVVDLHASGDGGLDYLVATDDTVSARHAAPDGGEPGGAGEVTDVATAPLGQLRWATGEDGGNRLVGRPSDVSGGADVVEADGEPTAVSLRGELVVETTADVEPAASREVDDRAVADVDQVEVEATNVASGETTDSLLSLEGAGTTAQGGAIAVADVTTPVCAVPRNRHDVQVLQPSPEQVEWAVHKAVRGELTGAAHRRPQGWRGYGLPAYEPQLEFARYGLFPDSGRIPAQVLLGVLAQESNLWQAARGALPGVAGNPLIGDYYGVVYNSEGRVIGMDYDDADCGYGIGQVTDGMRNDDGMRTPAQEMMIAVDYQANIAAAIRILEVKWQDGKALNTFVNDGDPSQVENWYFALWAYNSGWRTTGAGGADRCCLGWTNNPANSDWKFDRKYFMRYDLDDARTPQHWPYQEKVLGFAEEGHYLYGERTFRPIDGVLSLPEVDGNLVDRFVFCEMEVNSCSPTHADPGPEPRPGDRSFCTINPSRECWWHGHKTISFTLHGENDDAYSSGEEPVIPEEDLEHPPSCHEGTSLPSPGGDRPGAVTEIVDDVPNMSYNLVGCAGWPSDGRFTLEKGTLSGSGAPLADVDLHQIGAGYGGHFWYAHTNWETRDYMTVVGTWAAPVETSGWTDVFVHIPDHGADTFQADYLIFPDDASYQAWRNRPDFPTRQGAPYHRVVNQRWNQNRWIDLGVFELGAGARVVLTNETYSDSQDPAYGNRQIDIAWDAVAFKPAARPAVSYVAFGDSYSAGEGVEVSDDGEGTEQYYSDSDVGGSTFPYRNACHRSPGAYSLDVYDALKARLPGESFFHFAACSGAVTDTVLPWDTDGVHGWGEVPQLRQGWLDGNTTHVTISITGNDVEFSDIVTACVMVNFDSWTGGAFGPDGDCQAEYEPRFDELVNNAIVHLRDVLAEIRRLAPNARVLLVGYPNVIVTGDDIRNEPVCDRFGDDERRWLADAQAAYAARLRDEAAGFGAGFVDVRSAFAGHEACAPSHDDEWINALVAYSDSGSSGNCFLVRDAGRDCPGAGSFHPDGQGHDAYARAIRGAWGL